MFFARTPLSDFPSLASAADVLTEVAAMLNKVEREIVERFVQWEITAHPESRHVLKVDAKMKGLESASDMDLVDVLQALTELEKEHKAVRKVSVTTALVNDRQKRGRSPSRGRDNNEDRLCDRACS